MKKFKLPLQAILFFAVLLFFSAAARAETITVSQDGTGNYETLSEAIAAANPGDIIMLGPGTYDEPATDTIHIDKDGITIIGSPDDPQKVLIKDSITINSKNVKVSGVFLNNSLINVLGNAENISLEALRMISDGTLYMGKLELDFIDITPDQRDYIKNKFGYSSAVKLVGDRWNDDADRCSDSKPCFIVEFNGKPVTNAEELRITAASLPPGDYKFTYTWGRDKFPCKVLGKKYPGGTTKVLATPLPGIRIDGAKKVTVGLLNNPRPNRLCG
jgi:hypothetical protein